jgi:hypothetical protein
MDGTGSTTSAGIFGVSALLGALLFRVPYPALLVGLVALIVG